jgi:hypothetical protein
MVEVEADFLLSDGSRGNSNEVLGNTTGSVVTKGGIMLPVIQLEAKPPRAKRRTAKVLRGKAPCGLEAADFPGCTSMAAE